LFFAIQEAAWAVRTTRGRRFRLGWCSTGVALQWNAFSCNRLGSLVSQ
jgi:hypothetical protein